MKGTRKVLDALNDILTAELTGINQYFVHAKMCRNWGFERLAHEVYEESIGEMKHASELVDRILFLEGVPNLQKLDKIRVGESVPEQFKSDLALEKSAIVRLNKAITLCHTEGDAGSREILEHILTSEEKHLDWVEIQLGLIERLGAAAYLAEQLRK